MTPENILYIIVWLLVFEFVLTKFLAYLNTRNWSDTLPDELSEIYDEEKYKKSQKYEKEKYVFSIFSGTFSFVVMLAVVVFWGFGILDALVSDWANSAILQALYFFGIIILVQTIISLPFSYYSHFVIEEKYGFNKMTPKLFWGDTLKSLVLTAIIGGVILSLVVWIYTLFSEYFWILAWILLTGFSVFFMMFYSTLIVPLFNKQTPLEDGELRQAIQAFAKKVGFQLDNIYVMDGSKRSSKGNAYFSGFGPKKRIVLFDTLVQDMTTEEIVAVLAHEIGHYKHKHTLQMLAFSVIQTGVMMYILWLSLGYAEISASLGAVHGSFHVGIIAFAILFTPISIILGLAGNVLSRKNEYEADAYSRANYNAEELKSALKKLSRNNLSNLRPHPAYEFFYYSHPSVLRRLDALER